MMTGIAGRVGAGQRVHRIMRYVVPAKWGVARCGWAGKVSLVAGGVVSCEACVRADHAQETREPPDTETSGMGRPTPPEPGRV